MNKNITYLIPEYELHEPVIHIQTDTGIVTVSLYDDCSICPNTACYDIEKNAKTS